MRIVISLGGSVLGLNKDSLDYLNRFIPLIQNYAEKGYKFVVYCGGGDTARKYISVGESMGLNKDSLDWIGIYATRLNAIFISSLFGNNSNKKIIIDPTKHIIFQKNIIVAAGWKPGWSTDYDAVLAAKNIKADKIINITNVSHVYDKDPKKFKDAKRLKKLRWSDLRKLVGNKWKPGLNMPFDPIAAKQAEKDRLKIVIINNDIKKLRDYIELNQVNGTMIY